MGRWSEHDEHMCSNVAFLEWSDQSGEATALSSLALTFFLPSCLLLYVHAGPLKPRSNKLQSARTVRKFSIFFSDLFEAEKCYDCHMVSLKSPIMSHGMFAESFIHRSKDHM